MQPKNVYENRLYEVEWVANDMPGENPREAAQRFYEYAVESEIGRGFTVTDQETGARFTVDLDEKDDCQSAPEINANTVSMARREVCATCAGVEGGGFMDCPIYEAMPELFGGEADDCFCPFWDGERGRAEGIACVVCGKSLPEDEVIWAHKDGSLSTDTGEPYCTACLPSQPKDDGWNDPTRHNADCLCEVCLPYRKEQGWDCLYCGETFGDGEQKLDVEQDGVTFKVHVACWNRFADADDETIDAEAAADPILPDLGDSAQQDAALELLVTLQGFDFGQGSGNIYVARMLTAVHNKLYDEWAEPASPASPPVARLKAKTRIVVIMEGGLVANVAMPEPRDDVEVIVLDDDAKQTASEDDPTVEKDAYGGLVWLTKWTPARLDKITAEWLDRKDA